MLDAGFGREFSQSQGHATVSGRGSFDFIQNVLLGDHLISIAVCWMVFRQSPATTHGCP
jgi:hypothetical protein